MAELEGRVCAVTGGARGLGAAIARRFAAEGAHVVIGDVRVALAEETASSIGGHVRALALDVRDWESVEAFFADIAEESGRLDVAVNSAGVNEIHPSLELTGSVWNEILAVNLSGVFGCAQAAARRMGESGGSIINIASAAGVLPLAGRAPYCASKAGVIALTRVLGAEWAARGIRVNAIGPGWVGTDLVRDAIATGRLSEDAIRSRTPADRLGTPEEIAEVALFLATDRSSFFTGSSLLPDGGYTATGIRP
jgi:NAD(P)-dependent dehydrogenase (short-subunit alcohol dehydrogenase family)